MTTLMADMHLVPILETPARQPRYWVIAPVEAKPQDRFDRAWKFDLANGLISIGWSELGDVSKMSREQLSAAVATTYPDRRLATATLFANMIWAFYHEIAPGDIVLARRGRKILAAVGTVVRSAFYAPGKNPALGHPNFLEIAWHEQPRDKVFKSVVFPMRTLAELSEKEYRRFVESDTEVVVLPPAREIPADVSGPLAPTEDPVTFGLEKYLEEFIVGNFDTIFKRELKLYEDPDGNDGQQYSTDMGPIDILAVEPKSNSFVVIELKKGLTSDRVVGQILRYMGWVKLNLCTNGEDVKGLVVCSNPDAKLTCALAVTPNVDVRYYTVSFALREA